MSTDTCKPYLIFWAPLDLNLLNALRERIALLNLSSWCLVMVERLFIAIPRGCLRFVIMVFPDHSHLLFLQKNDKLLGKPLILSFFLNSFYNFNKI